MVSQISRRHFLAAMGTTAIAASTHRARALEPPAKRPNFVVFLADDLGFSDIGCYGSEIATPNLDGLARDGIRFTRGYSAARCCPTRAALLTGLYPHQAGMGGMVSKDDTPLGPYQGFLNDRCVTLAEALGPQGYSTYASGKWHVGERPPHWPRERGFDRYFGLISGACSYYEVLDGRQMVFDDDPYTPPDDGFYMTDAFADHAIDFLDAHDKANPFLLYVPFTAPHWPLHALPEDIAKYEGRYLEGWDKLRDERYARQLESGLIRREWPLSPRDPEVPAWADATEKAYWAELMAVYAAMVDRMDQNIGRVLEKLRAMGVFENTVVIFMSDNGGCAESVEARKLNHEGKKPGERGSFVSYLRPWANASDTPFRLFKKWTHEGGIASPFIVHWPAGIANRGVDCDQVVHAIDIMPTLLELAGAEYPESREYVETTPLPGRSFASSLNNPAAASEREIYWEHMGNTAVRKGDWKLVAEAGGDWELYNLDADRTELNDLSKEQPEKAQELQAAYMAWANATGVKEKT